MKGRNTTDGSHTVVQSGDVLGQITFAGNDGGGPENGARISCLVDTTPGGNDMPGRLVFSTTPDGSDTLSERMRITSAGRIGINENSPDSLVHITDGNPFLEIEGTSNSGDAGIFLNAKANHWLMRADNSGSQNTFSIKSGDTSSSSHIFLLNASGAIGLSGANYGSAGEVLTSNGSGSAAAWAAASGGKVVNYSSTTVTAAGSQSVGQGNYSNNIIGISYAAASSSNKLLLISSVSVGYQHGQSVAARFSVSGSAIDGSTGDAASSRRRATTAAWINSQYQVTNMTLSYQHSSPSTSAVTYGVQLGQSDNATQTVYWNRSYNDSDNEWRIRAATTLTIIELEG